MKMDFLSNSKTGLRVLFYCALFTVCGSSYSANNSKNGGCMVSDFKMIAFGNENPRIREEMAKKWLLAKGAECNETQIKIIQTSAASWLGTSLSHELSIIIDGIKEAKIGGDATKLMEQYVPAITTFGPSIERSVNPQPRAPVVQSAGVGGTVAMGGVVAVNNNFDNDNEDDRRKLPPGKFTPGARPIISQYFDEIRGEKECPPFMKPDQQGLFCVTVRPNRLWKLGEPLDGQSIMTEIPLKLRERLSSAPMGHKYIQINEDILLINERSNVVTDMILDFGGGVPVKKAPPKSDPKPKK